MISSPDELRRWIDETPQRHARVSDDECSCGWTNVFSDVAGLEPVRWQQHYDAASISDLGDVLPSDMHDATDGAQSRPVPWREAFEWATQKLDLHSDEALDLREALVAIADGCPNPVEVARKALQRADERWADDRSSSGE